MRRDEIPPPVIIVQYKHLQSEDITASDSFLDQSFDFDIAEDAVEVGVRWGL